MASSITFTGLTFEEATSISQSNPAGQTTITKDAAGTFTVQVGASAPDAGQPLAATSPTFAQVTDALEQIIALLHADPAPALKQSLMAVYQKLRDGLDAVTAANPGAAAGAVSDAAKQLQGIIDAGTASAGAIQPILGSLGVKSPGAVAPVQPPADGGGTTGGSDATPALSDRVPIPPLNQINVGLSACREGTMLAKFGSPGALTSDCSAATGAFVDRIRRNFDVGPFTVTGLDYAVESLADVFADVRKTNQQLYDQVKNDGMLCVRARRHSLTHFSNHSWGTAIDIYFGSAVVPQGEASAHRGNRLLAPYFNQHGWYWGAGFSGDSIDSMHFELADERIAKIPDAPMLATNVASPDPVVAAAAAPAGFQVDAKSAGLLGDIVSLVGSAQLIKHRFADVSYLGKLSSGQLVFQSQLQLDTDGWPDGSGRGDLDWQPDTKLQYADARSVNANAVPYFVLPKDWYAQFGIKVGDLGAVIYRGRVALAVFGDTGPKAKLGEASLQTFRQLGQERLRLNGQVINSGMGDGVITIVFSGSGPDAAYDDEQSLLNYIHGRGSALFSQLGGRLPDGFDQT